MRRRKLRRNRGERSGARLRRLRPNLQGGLDFVLLALLLTGLLAFRLNPTGEPWIRWLPGEPLLGSALLVALLAALWLGALRLRQPELLESRRIRVFLVLTVGSVALLGRAVDLLAPFLVPEPMGAYLVPVALGAGLVTVFVNAEVGLLLTVLLAFWTGLNGGGGLAPAATLAAFGSGTVAVFRCARLRRLSDLPLTGLEIGLVGVLFHAGAVVLAQGVEALNAAALIWTGLNGLVSVLLLFGGLPVAEYITQRTSPLGLVELLNPSHPLLVLLREKAPGTYHHSFRVADLAESAAQAIGADPLLAKVGGYYHDIGKIRRPEYFVENQGGGPNPHDEISPSMSKMILMSHIKDGVELAREYGLREDVIQFIRQHHGTTVIRYFYLKALREGKASAESMDDYRYNAELPQTKETAIVMLADGVEAATHGLDDLTQIDEVVREVVRSRVEDGQLRESPLTLRDLERIQEAFCETLRAMRHTRAGSFPAPAPASAPPTDSETLPSTGTPSASR